MAAEDELSILHQERTRLTSPEDIRKFLQHGEETSIWSHLQSFADSCDEVLTGNGFPHAMQTVQVLSDDSWEPVPKIPKDELKAWLKALTFPYKTELGFVYTSRKTRDFSDAWYAAQIGKLCREVMHHQENGKSNSDFIFEAIYRIGSLKTDWEWRRNQKPNVLRGITTKKGASSGGEAAARQGARKINETLSVMRKLVDSGMTISNAATTAYKKGKGKSSVANRQLWYRHRRKL
ncbi:hypothetical protein ACS0VU_04495 [Aliiroseovarius sp. KMU-71]|uniref:hypothetical protein n=1 Tax=Aliiroseovarius sp. KMU-71 TaxID=3453123 RepID=UPI003F452B89